MSNERWLVNDLSSVDPAGKAPAGRVDWTMHAPSINSFKQEKPFSWFWPNSHYPSPKQI
jgi:hypothetical protein